MTKFDYEMMKEIINSISTPEIVRIQNEQIKKYGRVMSSRNDCLTALQILMKEQEIRKFGR